MVEGTGGLWLSVLMLRPYPRAESAGKPTLPPGEAHAARRFVPACPFR